MNYVQCLDRLSTLGHELRGVKFDLEAIRDILDALGHPEKRYATAIVAGTNGKGSTSAMLASILERAGYRTGLYTSPHLNRVNERIRVNGEEISDADFARAFTDAWEAVDRLLARNALATRPSFFEYLTATAFLHLARAPVDFAVLEVGMGGRLDATNVTEPRVAVITNIALDHQEFLGSSIAAIAGEKAGVIKPGRPVVSSCEKPVAREVIRRRAAELGAPLIETPASAELSILRSDQGRYEFDLAIDGETFRGLVSPLMGRFQVKNAVAAVTAAQQLARQGWMIPAAAIAEGLRQARWPGRLEAVSEHPRVVLDGAHNPAAAREIADFAREQWAGKRLRLVYASMRDKAIGEISEILFPLAEKIYLTRPMQARAATPEEILAAAHALPPQTVMEPDPAQALSTALRDSAPEDIVLATGSLFLVGEIKRALLAVPPTVKSLQAQAAISEQR
jgi:dihydrofolate synthase / folylpolyglutamate synthase